MFIRYFISVRNFAKKFSSSNCRGLLGVRSSRSEVLYKKCVLKNFANFTGKHLCQKYGRKVGHSSGTLGPLGPLKPPGRLGLLGLPEIPEPLGPLGPPRPTRIPTTLETLTNLRDPLEPLRTWRISLGPPWNHQTNTIIWRRTAR